MSDEEHTRSLSSKTVAHGGLENLLLPEMEPGKAYLIVIKGRSVGRMLEIKPSQPATLGRATDAQLPVEDEGVSRRHAQLTPTSEGFAIEDLNSTNGLFVNNQRVKRHLLRDGDRVQVGTSTILKFCYQDVVEETFQKKLYESATRDPLVRTYNRQYLLDNLDAEFSYCARNGLPLSLLMIDIDHFKPVNDRYGHLAGDYALREVAALIQKDLRAEDVLARYGGEEFAVLLRHADEDRAFAVAERIRKNLAANVLEYEGQRFSLTVSIGLATLADNNHTTPLDLVRAADAFLYKAKQGGRDRTVCASTGDDEAKKPNDTTPLEPDDGAKDEEQPIAGGGQTLKMKALTPEEVGDGPDATLPATPVRSRRKSNRSKKKSGASSRRKKTQ